MDGMQGMEALLHVISNSQSNTAAYALKALSAAMA